MRSARHDKRIPLLVAYVDQLPLPPADAKPKGCAANCYQSTRSRPCPHQERETWRAQQGRLELLRNRALLHMLLSSGMRREEVTTLNRMDVDEGWADSAVIVGKGSKERRVFWDA